MKLISIACLNLLLLAKAAKQYVATFAHDNNGIAGTVTVDNGQLLVNLDLSDDITLGQNGFPAADGSTISFEDCTTNGLSYHIHKQWSHGDSDDKIGGIECSGTYTSGHWDPWQACGTASGNMYCGDGTVDAANDEYGCIPKAAYEPMYDADPFSAEVGDWSSKYSKIELDEDNQLIRTDSSFYEVLPSEMKNLSIVFHCNAGDRAFCAPFLESATAASATVPNQDGESGDVIANFATLSSDSMIMLAADGTITVNIDGSTATDIDECSEFEYSIFEAGTLTEAASGDDCSGVGLQYDPTAQCLPWSGNDYCTDGELCEDSAYSYNCDFSSNRYSCAPGDLSGKVGELLTVSAPYSKTMAGPNTLIPPINSLIGKVIGINCPYSDSNSTKFLACAPIEAIEDSGNASISFIMAVIVSFIPFFY